jgi:EAL domain-containing protein (putative c-di-GMP-specific phosphodiesterase class I)
MVTILDEVVELGVSLALDDFGTGYSSLSLLHDLPVHTLKIDRSFVQSIDEGPERRPFVEAIVDLGSALGLAVVAEGVERVGQVAALQRLGCRIGQGFHFAPPLEASEFEEYVRASRGRSAA